MSGFIKKSACHGYRPSHLASVRRYQRPGQLARLLKERKVVRFIVAPYGYGKTSLALEYAEIVFSCDHVFWVNGQSPCFLRDLDAKALAASCFEYDPEASLVIFDDVPPLDVGRAELFSTEMDSLLEGGCEVLVVCEPSSDAYASYQRDRTLLGAGDLLLSDSELDLVRSSNDRVQQPSSTLPPTRRVPALAWSSGSNEEAEFLERGFYEDVPADVLLAMASMIVLQAGSLEDLQRIGPIDGAFLSQMSENYPHLGYDEENERFATAEFTIEEIVPALRKRLEKAVSRAKCLTRDELAGMWATTLLDYGQADRACAVVHHLCLRPARGKWAVEHAFDLVRLKCFYSTLKVIRESRGSVGPERFRLMALESLCLHMLGGLDAAAKVGKRPAFGSSAPDDARICALLVLNSQSDGVPEQVQDALVQLACAKPADSDALASLRALALARCGAQDPAGLLALWMRLRDEEVDESALFVVAAWVFDAFLALPGIEGSALHDELSDLHHMERYVRDRLVDPDEVASDYFLASAGLAMEQAQSRGLMRSARPLPMAVLLALRSVELSTLDQMRKYEHDVEVERAMKRDWSATHPDRALARAESLPESGSRSVPTLSLRLFGVFDVAIGGVPVDQKYFKRQHVRALLVLLAINHGRELSRQTISETMWPESRPEIARKNFYTIWSQLRRALTLPDGTCPYLIRHQYSCSLERRYVRSDVVRLNEICRELFFGQPERRVWADLYTELERDFTSSLMPNEGSNELILEARQTMKTRLVDALVAATDSIVQYGAPQQGMWFARFALNHDATREDAYAALMRAQVACGQRTAAISTYLSCRRMLSERLGVDPSPETEAFYQSLLDMTADERKKKGGGIAGDGEGRGAA